MSKRARRQNKVPNVWEQSQQNDIETVTASGYGDLEALAPKVSRVVAKLVDIFSISPDQTQPRRVLPSAIRASWDGKPKTVHRVLDLWLAEAEKERKKPIDLSTYLTIGETDRGREAEEYQGDVDELPQIGVSEGESGPIEASFLHLVELAASIRRDGLTNPITVVRKGPKYTIETGERRWLAYHLLNAYFESFGDSSEEDWSKIPARIMDEANVWRQASENNARDNLNAVSKTRQLALLLMDLLGREHFQPFEAFEVEQDFYAQVADGNEWRIPRGSGEMLLNAIGLKNPRQLRYYRALLRMPNELWIQADDLDLTEGAIRDLIQDTGKIVPVSAPREKPEYTRGKPLASKEDRERLRMLRSLGDEVSNVDDTTRQMLLQEIEAHKDWLKRIEKLLKG